jgi:hypothetical protein
MNDKFGYVLVVSLVLNLFLGIFIFSSLPKEQKPDSKIIKVEEILCPTVSDGEAYINGLMGDLASINLYTGNNFWLANYSVTLCEEPDHQVYGNTTAWMNYTIVQEIG